MGFSTSLRMCFTEYLSKLSSKATPFAEVKGAKGREWPECCCRPYVRRFAGAFSWDFQELYGIDILEFNWIDWDLSKLHRYYDSTAFFAGGTVWINLLRFHVCVLTDVAWCSADLQTRLWPQNPSLRWMEWNKMNDFLFIKPPWCFFVMLSFYSIHWLSEITWRKSYFWYISEH